jgi:nucleoside-diphosphate-sugar epimerase
VRVLVLGASGFIGRWVARALTAEGAELHAAVRGAEAFRQLAGSWKIDAAVHEIDALRTGEVARVVDEVKPVIAFNLVGYGVDRSEVDEDRMRLLNAELPGDLAAALARHVLEEWTGQRLVHVGSALEYGLLTGVASEHREGPLHTSYGRTKRAGTTAVASFATSQRFAGVTARLFTVFGQGEHDGRLLPTLIRASRSGEDVHLSAGTQRRDFTYVEDVASGLLALGIAPCLPGEVVNLATGHLHRVREFVGVAGRRLGISPSRIRFGVEPIRSDEMQLDGVDTGRLRALLEWTPDGNLDNLLARALAPGMADGTS